MTLPIRLLPEARVEFDHATDWYEQQRTGLGTRFVGRVSEVLRRIGADPHRHPAVYLDVRKALVPKFPYVILYREGTDEVLVISVFHTSRDPSIWKSRT
jgi:plasmid stabilization system protein ParE